MIFNLIAKKMIGIGPEESRELRQNLEAFFKGIVSFPIYFPGTSFHKCMNVLHIFQLCSVRTIFAIPVDPEH